MSNKQIQALDLPKLCNINPRSCYNKAEELVTFVKEESLDLIFISESWERENLPLQELLKLEDHTVISNVNQRVGIGGRPALIVNNKKFDVQNITNTLVQIPWGVEAVWCVITPKNVSHDSKIQKIVCCSLYCKPNSKTKTLLHDHISEAYHTLSTKYGRGLHFVLAGDTNDLKLEPILNLSPNFVQIVTKWTRMAPPAILDPIIMTLANYYQEPLCLEPLAADTGTNGKKSDHKIVIAKPISVLNNKSCRQTKHILLRPFPKSGIEKMKNWLVDRSWREIYQEKSAHEKAEKFHSILMNKLDEFFPTKMRKINSDDQPWISFKLKQIDRKRKRIFRKQRRSEKWKKLNQLFKQEMRAEKTKYYKNKVAELKASNPSQWYSCLKKLSSHDQMKSESVQVAEISNLSDQEQADKIADAFCAIQNQYEPIQSSSINIPPFSERQIPQFSAAQVWFALSRVDTNKATVSGDFPAQLIKQFAAYLAEPFTDIINTSLKLGEYPQLYKFEVCTPVPKVHPVQKVSQLRNISGLLNWDKIMEKLIAQLIISDMQSSLDPAQFGNQKGTSTQHYLITMLHRILTAVDNNSRKDVFAVVANMVDWNNAFPRQCPTLGIESFLKCGVRPSLIPLLINYFQDRQMSVKWHGCRSSPRVVKGGGPQGATLGILEYLAQSNDNSNCVNEEDRFKFIDDLTILEIVNLLTIGLTSYNMKQHVPADIPQHGQFIPPQNLESQKWLEKINQWTINQKMKINGSKTKTMIFNFTKNHKFTTRLEMNGEQLEVIDSTRLLGTIISNNLSWDENVSAIVRKSNARLELLRKLAPFGVPDEDMKIIYILFIRSLLEQSAPVWHSSLTQENSDDLERIQKSALKIILQQRYKNYSDAMKLLELDTLKQRREQLCLSFALKCLKHPKFKKMFPENQKEHEMNTRDKEKYKVQFALTKRLQNSPIIYMQKLLNQNEKEKQIL